MKSGMLLLCGAALLALGLISPAQAQSPTFQTLYDFSSISGPTSNNIDGAGPEAPLLLVGNTLYGTAAAGGGAGNGTIFKIDTDGSNFTTVYFFSAGNTDNVGNYTNHDGANPLGSLIISGDTLYGTTVSGGTGGSGSVFRVNTDGLDFTNLHSFSATSGSPLYLNSDGANPEASLVLVGNTLYGTALNGGNEGNGTVFKVNTDSTGFGVVHTFAAGDTNDAGFYTNSDGADSAAALVLSGNTLFGTAEYGGMGGGGSVFSLNILNSDFTNLYSFTEPSQGYLGLYFNLDGAFPISALILSSNTLYGTAQNGGDYGAGTVFSLQADGSNFMTLYNFSEPIFNTLQGDYTNTDGFFPVAALVLSGDTLYGTADSGGIADNGTLFSFNLGTQEFTNLYEFSVGNGNAASIYTNSDGAFSVASLILSGNTLYGSAEYAGTQGDGTIFALVLPGPPSLGIVPSGNQIVISWPASATNYLLQTTTDLSLGSWSAITNGITTVGIDNVFTSAASGQAAFFRLQQQ